MSVGSLLLQVGKLRLRVGEWIRAKGLGSMDWDSAGEIAPYEIERIDKVEYPAAPKERTILCIIYVRPLDGGELRQINIYKGGWTVPSILPMYQGTFKACPDSP
jgi:hypothetical protein